MVNWILRFLNKICGQLIGPDPFCENLEDKEYDRMAESDKALTDYEHKINF